MVVQLKNVWKEFVLEREKEMTLKERVVNLNKRKKEEKILALKDINLVVESGECFGILGKNGSGKTTLLKIIAGILKPTKGFVEVNGKIIPILTLGLGFQKELTAKENVYLYASVLGMSKKEIDEKYEEIVKFSELERVMDVKLKNFSDGMVMRLSFSVAFHVDADIILIDEILAVGDASFQMKCLEKIKELKESGKTIIMVSQTTAEIRRFCDRALILDKGEIVFCGKASEVCEKYEEIIESERLERYNGIVSKETGVEFKAFYEKPFVLRSGKKCEIEVKIGKPVGLAELLFIGNKVVRMFSKNFDSGKIVFRSHSLPIPEGEYEVWVKCDFEFLSKKPFKVMVKGLEESEENRIYMLPGCDVPFQDLTVIFGKECEKEMEMFEKGKTIFVFRNLEEAFKDGKKACLVGENKILLIGDMSCVLEEFKERVCFYLAKKHFNDILANTSFGKMFMVS
ncbi:MAG: ABC transporter ATP-binding protein [Candidatus Aenigmatarchaeota archaeon]